MDADFSDSFFEVFDRAKKLNFRPVVVSHYIFIISSAVGFGEKE